MSVMKEHWPELVEAFEDKIAQKKAKAAQVAAQKYIQFLHCHLNCREFAAFVCARIALLG